MAGSVVQQPAETGLSAVTRFPPSSPTKITPSPFVASGNGSLKPPSKLSLNSTVSPSALNLTRVRSLPIE
jgi:hypothetical protein